MEWVTMGKSSFNNDTKYAKRLIKNTTMKGVEIIVKIKKQQGRDEMGGIEERDGSQKG